MSTSKLYMLLIAIALTFNVACGEDEAVENDAGTDNPGGVDAPGGTPGGVDAPDEEGGSVGGGNTSVGGTPEGGTPEGGTPEGGASGGAEAGVEFEERVGLGNTAPLSCEGDYCPSARLSGLQLPANRADATASGCRLQGNENGATLGALLGLIGGGDLNDFVNPDENGDIALLLLNHLEGWAAGATGNDAGELTANFYVGASVNGETFIDPASLSDAGEPLISFESTTVTEGLMSTPESSFSLSLPLLEGLDLALSLEKASLVGDIAVNEVGFSMSNGVLGGYLTRDSLEVLLEGLYAACGIGQEPVGTPPEFCSQATGFGVVTGNVDNDITTLTTFVAFDTIVDDAGITGCSPDRATDCNAISLCLLVEMEPVGITGVQEGE